MTRICSSVQLKLEHHRTTRSGRIWWQRMRKEKRRQAKERREKRRRIKTLRTFEANLPSSIANSTFSCLISFPQSSASSMIILRPFPLLNYETWVLTYAGPRRWLADWMPRLALPLWHYFPHATNFSITFIRMQLWILTWPR